MCSGLCHATAVIDDTGQDDTRNKTQYAGDSYFESNQRRLAIRETLRERRKANRSQEGQDTGYMD